MTNPCIFVPRLKQTGCYAEPIVSTRAYWEQLRSEDTIKFLEIITVTNLPDPLKAQDNPQPAWHAWRRRLGRTIPRYHHGDHFSLTEWTVFGIVWLALYTTYTRVRKGRDGMSECRHDTKQKR